MDINEFVVKFASAFDDVDPAELSAETKFKELEEWDSLKVLSLIAVLAGEFGVTISGVDMNQCSTIAEVYELVEKGK